MSISLLAALAGTVLALAGLIASVIRCLRTPRTDILAWTAAMLGLLVALAAQAAGFASGFGPATFRAVQLGAQVVATLGLALGLAEVAARNLPVRFAARLATSALGVVGLVILATDPLGTAVFSKTFPAATVFYQPVSTSLLNYGLLPFTALIALIAVAVTARRARQHPAWRATFPVVAAAAAAALILAAPGLAYLGAKATLSSVFPFLCIVAAALTWLAVVRTSGLRLDVVHRSGVPGALPSEGGGWGGPETGEFDPYTDGGGYTADDLAARAAGAGAGGPGAVLPGGYPSGFDSGGPGAGGPGPGNDDRRGLPAGSDPYAAAPGPQPQAAPGLPAVMPGGPAMPATDDHEAWSQLFGQIAIYTLLEGTVEPFDGLIEAVVGQVRSREPDTLVYIVHAVPSAPLQRILYEVYRDRGAYEAHQRQPYVAQFELDRKPFVLATNVIELGLQQAKVSQLPALADVLREQSVAGASAPGGRPASAVPAGQVPVGSAAAGPGPAGYPPPGGPAAYPPPGGPPADRGQPRRSQPGGQPGYGPPPGHSQPNHGQPNGQPGYAQPSPARPSRSQPGQGQPGQGQPGQGQPGQGQPGQGQPGRGQPGQGQPSQAPQPGYSPAGQPPPDAGPDGQGGGWGPDGRPPAAWPPPDGGRAGGTDRGTGMPHGPTRYPGPQRQQ
jgi:quinol monooxygenase YgiN